MLCISTPQKTVEVIQAISFNNANCHCVDCGNPCNNNFCSVPCIGAFNNKWRSNVGFTYYKRPYQATVTTTKTLKLHSDKKNTTYKFRSPLTLTSTLNPMGKYVVPILTFDAMETSKQLNVLAWKGFNLSWEKYVEEIVIPCCNPGDSEIMNNIKTWEVPPATSVKLIKLAKSGQTRNRIFYLLYSVVYNCCQLQRVIPPKIRLKKVDGNFVLRYPGKRASSSKKKMQVGNKNSAKKRKIGRPTEPVPISSRLPSAKRVAPSGDRLARRKKLLSSNTQQKQQEKSRIHARDKEKERVEQMESDYSVEKHRRLLDYRKKVHFIMSMSKYWSKTHEQLNAVGGGMPGSIQTEGSFNLLNYIDEVLKANDIPRDDVLMVEEGGRTLDQMRSNMAYFPEICHFAYEYDNFLHFSLFDQVKTNKSLMELQDLISVYDDAKISHAKYGVAFNVAYTEGVSNKLTFPQFLKQPCVHPKCTRHLKLRQIKRMKLPEHKCATCGFNQHDVYRLFGKYLISTWFSKSWGAEKEPKIKHMGMVSSRIICFFQGDERSYTNEESKLDYYGLETSTVVMLNSGLAGASEEQKWVCYEKGFSCSLVGGGTTFVGAIYIRKKYMKRRAVVLEKMLQCIRRETLRERLPFNNNPSFEYSPLLQMLSCFRTANVQLAEEALAWQMSLAGAWEGFCSLPDVGSISKWVIDKIKNTNQTEIDFVIEAMKKHIGSFRRGHQYIEDGVRGQGTIDLKPIEEDLNVLLTAAEERDNVYNYTKYFCRNCRLEGNKPQIFRHVYANNACSKDDVFYVCEETVAEIIQGFEDRINEMERKTKEADEAVELLTQEVSNLRLSQAQLTQVIVMKVVDVFEHKYINMSAEKIEKEYLYRLKSNITYRQFREYSRWNKVIKKQRTYEGRFWFEVNGVEYSVPTQRIETKNDAQTRIKLIKAMYDLDFPKPEKLQGGNVDGIVVDSATKAMEARLRLSLRLKNTIRAKRFHHFNGRLLYAINWDGAPFQKSGALKSQSVLLAACLNEGFTTTIAAIIFLGVISASEDSEYSKELCKNIDKKLYEFKKKVEEEGIEIGGLRFTSVEYLLCCDLKATNKLQGVAAHGAEFWSTTHVGLTKDSVGYGVTGRSKSVAGLFKNHHRPKDDKTEKWKPGDLPIPINSKLRKKLRNDVKTRMAKGKYGNGEGLDTDDRKKWEAKAKKMAKKEGHTFYLEEFFPKTEFVTNTYCALHYKTVKVLDFLDLSCMALMNWDRYNGRVDVIDSSLDYFLNGLENDKRFKSQLTTYAADARLFWIQVDLKQQLCFQGPGLKKLNSLLQKKAGVKAPRLLGRQANIPLALLDELAELLIKSRKCGRRNERRCVGDKTEDYVKKDMDQVISSLLAFLAAVRDVTFWMGQSGTDIYKDNKDASEDDYLSKVHEINKKLKDACITLELIQTNLFENYVRPYDVSATYAMPHISDILADLGITQGRAGLLECYESFHKYYANLTAFESVAGAGSNGVSRNSYKFTSMWLIYVYLPLQTYGRQKEERKSKGWKYRSHVIRNDVHKYFHETLTNPTLSSCFCGKLSNSTTANPRSDTCSFCNAGNTTCTVAKIFELVSRTKLYMGKRPDRNRGTKRKMEGIYDEWVAMRHKQWIKGLKVIAVF
jgi:hypothetical protein